MSKEGNSSVPEHPGETGETQAEQEEEDSEEIQSTDDEQHSNQDGAAKKKKKKKKKKKAGAAAGTDSEAAGAASAPSAGAVSDDKQQQQLDKQEAERRFHRAVDSAKQGEDMWVLLGSANVHDAKVKKLFEALRTNSSITSVNLSDNHIGEEGVQALVSVLQQGGCSELISLDLRGNSLSPEAEALLADLGKKRKQLAISTGPMPPPEPEGSSSSSTDKPAAGRGRGRGRGRAGAAGSRAAAGDAAGNSGQQQQQQQQQMVLSEQSFKELAKASPMFRRYFQFGEEEADDGSSGEEEGEQLEQAPPPEEAWAKVDELLPRGVDSIPELGAALETISKALDAEMSSMPAQEEAAQLDDFQPHFRAVVQHLPQLQEVLALQPPPKVHQSSKEPQAAVGSHRMWTCSILHMMLLHNNAVIDRAVADAGVLPVALALALHHDRCSALQCRAAEMLRSSLQSSVQELWRGLFGEGFGQQLQRTPQQQGSSSSSSSMGPAGDGSGSNDGSNDGSSGSSLLPPLHEALVEIAAGAVGQPMGKRPCATGFAVEVANTLLQASDASVPEQLCPALASLLDGCAAWKSSIAPDGAIHRLLKQQDGQLCGPPPPRPAPSVGSIEEDTLEPLGLSNLLNDADLTAFLAGRLGPGRLGAEL